MVVQWVEKKKKPSGPLRSLWSLSPRRRSSLPIASPEIQLASHPADFVPLRLHLQPCLSATTTGIPLSLSSSPLVVHGGSGFGGSFGMGGSVMNPYIGVGTPDSRVWSGGLPALGWWGVSDLGILKFEWFINIKC